MSTTRNVLRGCEGMLSTFVEEFGFYLDSLDRIFELQGRIGLDEPALSALAERDQNRFKSYLFLCESANTTSMGALRLFSGNLYSDAFALLRMMYEIACLMHYGNRSPDHGDKVYATMFKSGLEEHAHSKREWSLIQKAERDFETEKADLTALRQYINNFGAHISRSKIVLGNVTALANRSASTVFLDNSRRKEFLMGLDLLHCLLMLVLEEYDKQAASHPGALPSVAAEIADHNRRFCKEVRPRLQARGGLASD
ncbi:MAG: hypothetical protein Q8Q12_04510 [bacterium]|nr:hypothetical protein [bacterium]